MKAAIKKHTVNAVEINSELVQILKKCQALLMENVEINIATIDDIELLEEIETVLAKVES